MSFCLLSFTFLPAKRWPRFSIPKAQIAFPAGVKNLNEPRR
jgi:hypothetical protein